MPYGLTGATQTCQQGLDTILADCKYCVDNYIDDCIVYSDDMESHMTITTSWVYLERLQMYIWQVHSHSSGIPVLIKWCDSIR